MNLSAVTGAAGAARRERTAPDRCFGPYEVLVGKGSAGGTVVVFNSLGNPPSKMTSWEFGAQIASVLPDWQVICVRDQSRSWFNAEPAALREMAHWLARKVAAGPGTRVVTLGSSVGGFGAILFARLLQADTCIALSPQIAVARSLTAGSDPRWNGFLPPDPDLLHPVAAPAADCTYHVLYPAFDLLDVWQASLFSPDEGHFYARLTEEHNCAAELKAQGLLSGFIGDCILSPAAHAGLVDTLPGRFNFRGQSVKAFMQALKESALAGASFRDWCEEAGAHPPFDGLFLPYWCHVRGDAVTAEELSVLSEGQLLSMLKKFPSRKLAQMVRARSSSSLLRPGKSKGWLTTWRAWRADSGSLGHVLQSGWNSAEGWGAWSLGLVSELSLPVMLVPATAYRLRLTVRPPQAAPGVGLRLVVRMGADVCATQDFEVTERGDLVLSFTAPATVSPTVSVIASVERTICPLLDHPTFPDPRAYGFGLEAISIGVQ